MPKVKYICLECGIEAERYLSKNKPIPQFCSNKCKFDNWKKKETEHRKYIKCDNCNKDFLMYDWQFEKSENHFCCQNCHYEFASKQIETSCENCGKAFKKKKSIIERGWARFCSWSCRSQFLNGKNHYNFTKEQKICKQCNKTFYTQKSQLRVGKGIFCSKQCWYNSMKLERPEDSLYFYVNSFWNELRVQCYKRDNFTCQRCGTHEKLQAHHIIPRRKGGKDELDNLTTLCASCHRIVEWGGK